MYAVLISYQILTTIAPFSSSALADARFPTLVSCEHAKKETAQKAVDIAYGAARNIQGLKVVITGAKCVKP